MFEDLRFYIEQHFRHLDGNDPDMVLCLAQKIVASHYRKHIGFLHSLVSHVQHSMSRQEKLEVFNPTDVEKQWSDVQSYERRLSYFCTDLESIMLQCRIPFSPPNAAAKAWYNTEADFQFLHMTIKDVRRRGELLSSSITGLAGIARGRQAVEEQTLSRQEATSVKTLTFVGLVFIPLGFAAALCGIPAPYGPGNAQFRVYFILALPLSAITFVTYFVFGRSLARGGKWELRKHSHNGGDSLC